MRKRSKTGDTDSADAAAPEPGEVRERALRLLVRREHSAAELRRKLQLRGYSTEVIDPVIAELLSSNQLSESRYSEEFLRSRISRGQGPLKVRSELRQRGLTDSQIDEALASADVHWGRLAGEVRARRFGANPPKAFPERARQSRFLESRGFSSDHIRAAMDGDLSEDG